MKKLALSIFVLSLCATAQVVSIGPLGQPPIDASQCKVLTDGQTALCFAKDGVHVSLAGAPFGPPLPQGQPGKDGIDGKNGNDGINGKDGTSATVAIGTVATTDPGTPATVKNSGTVNDAIFDFTIPKGDKGDKGDKGIQGLPGVFPQSVTLTCVTGFGGPSHTSKCTVTQ